MARATDDTTDLETYDDGAGADNAAEGAGERPSGLRRLARIALGVALVGAGIGHLTFARRDFRAQVPHGVTEATGFSEDQIVLMSGIAEIGLGGALAVLGRGRRDRRRLGVVAALFFAAVFPGNVAQWVNRRDGFGLDTDDKRALRLLGQPLLIAWALWSTRR
jgi:uncharacterized membrane protein